MKKMKEVKCSSILLRKTISWYATRGSDNIKEDCTWISPGDRDRNQVDYILVEQRYKNIVKNCHTYLRANCNSNHALLVAKYRILRKTPQKMNGIKKSDVDKVKMPETRRKFQAKLWKQKNDTVERPENV